MNIQDVLTKVEFSKEHMPVLPAEVLEAFLPFANKSSLRYFDGTFGRGGHFRAIKELLPQIETVAMDQDIVAVDYAKSEYKTLVESGKFRIIHANFSQFSEYKLGLFDMMLLDLGVSSPQFDQAERGFSFYHDGPLDMRMNQQETVTAEMIINTTDEKRLVEIFQEYGEVRRPHRVVRAIVHDRKTKAFTTTRELAGLIERVDGWRQKGVHPATQYFMALRLAVNAELEVVTKALPQMMEALLPGGRLAVISFHSLEDRIVKNIFREAKDLGRPVHKKVIVPTQEECKTNPRSRSAKLRIFERRVQDELGQYQES